MLECFALMEVLLQQLFRKFRMRIQDMTKGDASSKCIQCIRFIECDVPNGQIRQTTEVFRKFLLVLGIGIPFAIAHHYKSLVGLVVCNSVT